MQERDAIERLRGSLFIPVAHRLGFDFASDDTPELIKLRALALKTAAECGDPKAVALFQRGFARLLSHNDDTEILPNLRTSVYTVCTMKGGEVEFNKMLDMLRNPPSPSHRDDAMAAVCQTRVPELVDRLLAVALSEDGIQSQDVMRVLAGLVYNPVGRRKVWEFFKTNYAAISERFQGTSSLGYLVHFTI